MMLPVSACKKVDDFFASFKKRHIFCEHPFFTKISLCSPKILKNQAFLMYRTAYTMEYISELDF